MASPRPPQLEIFLTQFRAHIKLLDMAREQIDNAFKGTVASMRQLADLIEKETAE